MMKKLLSIALLLMTAWSVQAQSLDGKWVTKITEKELAGDFYLIFNSPKLEMNIQTLIDEKEFSIKLTIILDATYTLKDNVVDFTISPQKTKVKIDDLEAKGEMAEQINGDSEMKQMLIKMLQKKMDKEIGENPGNIPLLSGESKLTILSNNGQELVVKGANKTKMTFKRVE